MIAVVLDTNTLVSGLGWSGAPSVLVDAVLAGELMLVSSPPLLDELERVLAYPKLVHVFNDPAGVTALVRSIADVVEPTSTLAAVADEPDNRVLEAAVEAGVDAVGSKARPNISARYGGRKALEFQRESAPIDGSGSAGAHRRTAHSDA